MSVNAFTSLVIADSGAVVGWTITAANAYAWGKDLFNVLEKPPVVAPLAAADAGSARRLTNPPDSVPRPQAERTC
jgi:hypothetical protein